MDMFSDDRWTSEDIQKLDGKKIVVTGANSGIGFEATKKFAMNGAEVIMACRDLDKAGEAREEILEEIGDADIKVSKLDLADLSSVKDFADEYRANHEELDVLCNNAGIMGIPREETDNGFEKQMGVNHLGHFALTAHLFDLVEEAEGRIVTQSSGMHKQGDIDFDDFMMEESYDPWKAYSNSKLANLLFAYQLDLKLRHNDMDSKSLAVHPGYANTRLQEKAGESRGSSIMKYAARTANTIFAQSPEKGALPMLYAATEDDVGGGDFIGPGGLMNMRGYPEKQRSSQDSYNMEEAEKLWKISEELTGVNFEIDG